MRVGVLLLAARDFPVMLDYYGRVLGLPGSDDIVAERARLEGRGVVFDEADIGEEDWGRFCRFADPEGNTLQIYQPWPDSGPG